LSLRLRYDSVVKQFETDEGSVLALNKVSAEVREGELFCLLGPSGCGKTTLLRSTAGLETINDGKIFYGDEDFSLTPPYKRNIGMVFQNYALYPHMTVFENVAYALRIRKSPAEEIKKKVEEIMELVGLPGVLNRGPSELSGGQQQRVALARALVYDPELLLLDEPLANLDAKLKVQMRSEIRRIQKAAGVTTIYVTHDQLEAMAISDRLAIMDNGVICQVGTPNEIYSNPKSQFIAGFIGTMNFFEARIRPEETKALIDIDGITKEVQLQKTAEAAAGVTVAVRPEHVRLTTKDSGTTTGGGTEGTSGGFEGRIQILQFLGMYIRYQVVITIGGEEKVIQVDIDREYADAREGDSVRIDFSPEHMIVFQHGERIA